MQRPPPLGAAVFYLPDWSILADVVLYDETPLVVYDRKGMSQNENSHSIAPPEPGSAWMNSHHLVSILMQHLPACIFIKNTSGHYVAANAPMVEILGFAHAGELIGKTDHDIFTGEKARANRLDEERVMQTGQPITDRVEYIERAARSFWCSMTKVPLRDDTGAITGVIGIGRDISGGANRVAGWF